MACCNSVFQSCFAKSDLQKIFGGFPRNFWFKKRKKKKNAIPKCSPCSSNALSKKIPKRALYQETSFFVVFTNKNCSKLFLSIPGNKILVTTKFLYLGLSFNYSNFRNSRPIAKKQYTHCFYDKKIPLFAMKFPISQYQIYNGSAIFLQWVHYFENKSILDRIVVFVPYSSLRIDFSGFLQK